MLMQILFGIPASLILAQAAQETGYGSSLLAQESKNYFGIKGEGKVYGTTEVIPGVGSVAIEDEFRTYSSKFGSFWDHAQVLRDEYPQTVGTPPEEGAVALQIGGYATDPDYSANLLGLIEAHDLKEYDRTAKTVKIFGIGLLLVLFLFIAYKIFKRYGGRKR